MGSAGTELQGRSGTRPGEKGRPDRLQVLQMHAGKAKAAEPPFSHHGKTVQQARTAAKQILSFVCSKCLIYAYQTVIQSKH
jgi:hypothetical protein